MGKSCNPRKRLSDGMREMFIQNIKCLQFVYSALSFSLFCLNILMTSSIIYLLITGHCTLTETHFNQTNVGLLIHLVCLEYGRELDYPIHVNKEIIQKCGSDEVFCIQLWIAHEGWWICETVSIRKKRNKTQYDLWLHCILVYWVQKMPSLPFLLWFSPCVTFDHQSQMVHLDKTLLFDSDWHINMTFTAEATL